MIADPSLPGIQVRQARTELADPALAVAELAAQLGPAGASVILFFCAPSYDLPLLGQALARTFSAPLVGCTSAGQFGAGGYYAGGITAVSLESRQLRATPYLIAQLNDSGEALDVGYRAVAELVRTGSKGAFGLLLIDGLSNAEERTTAALFQAMGDVPLIGGSAGDDLALRQTHIYCEGEFRTGAAAFVLFDTSLPFATFKVQNIVPTADKLVVTAADPEQRVVSELNGKPAARAYAEKLGIDMAALDSAECARHPLLLRAGEEYFVRGVRAVHPDGSIAFACAVEEGLVFTIGQLTPLAESLVQGLTAATNGIASPAVVIGLDCVTRRMELERTGEAGVVGEILARHGVVGFCTYGEQFDSKHLAQTFTAVVMGGG